MQWLLIIDTALPTAHIVAATTSGEVVGHITHTDPKGHAAFVQVAIQQLMAAHELSWNQLVAVGAVAGPGSYTGVRVGLASAKGLCFAVNKPLVMLNTLAVLAEAATKTEANIPAHASLVPMIDARRMEVFTAVFSADAHSMLLPTQALVLQYDSYSEWLNLGTTYFFGDGAAKWQQKTNHTNACFLQVKISPMALASCMAAATTAQQWADLYSAEPIYGKAFHDTTK